MTCHALTIERTNASNLVRKFGDQIQLRCEDGYVFESGRSTIYLECMANKRWNDTDACIRKYLHTTEIWNRMRAIDDPSPSDVDYDH